MSSNSSRAPDGAGDIEALSYEEARAQLVAAVGQLEAGGANLEDSLAAWERGEALAARCQALLDQARARLEATGKGEVVSSSAAATPNPATPEEVSA
jgi:exodeoxyribonuclease VII small subunit